MEKLEKMKKNRAGNYIPIEFVVEIVNTIKASDFSDDFLTGAHVALSYLCCPKKESMHGAGFDDYLKNARAILDLKNRVSKTREVISMLKSFGIEVIDVEVVRGGK